MKFFGWLRRKKAFNTTAQELITPEAVRRANAKMMAGIEPSCPDVFERHGLKRPTSAEIEAAGREAMRALRLSKK